MSERSEVAAFRSADVCIQLALIIPHVLDPEARRELVRIRARLAGQARIGGAGDLSPRECEALEYAALGLSNAEIAQHMKLASGTVKAYLRSVMTKLDCHNRVAAVNAARAHGYVL